MSRVTEGYLVGNLLVAMPSMGDPRFERTLVYLCAHSESGALGLVVNRLTDEITFPELLAQVGVEPSPTSGDIRVHFGGPVEESRGFVLHSADYSQQATMEVTEDVSLTASVDVLAAIASGGGPRRRLLALGYAGWGPGQLEAEIQSNGWLHADADDELLFGSDVANKWRRAMAKIGLDISTLSREAGRA